MINIFDKKAGKIEVIPKCLTRVGLAKGKY
jgi:hypothetical protein